MSKVFNIVVKGAEKSITDLGFVGTLGMQPINKSAYPCTFSEEQIASIENANLPFSIDVSIGGTNIKLIFEHKSNTESVFVSFSGYTEINGMIAPFFATTTSDETVLDIIGLL